MSEANTVWIAVATHANAEGQAVQNLNRQGYECYCPVHPRASPDRSHAADEASASFCPLNHVIRRVDCEIHQPREGLPLAA